ncbi:hypothetical protein B0H14DRAFT_869457 [Mycena olivaceomarginata]|nr:hypothetical protein B0H14DRAFT_869457 [Mycena olivaceomarginata]
MSSSGAHILAVGALNTLQDLSSGSSIPFLQPLVNIAVRIHGSAQGARKNRKEAEELVKIVCLSLRHIWQAFPTTQSSSPSDEHEESIAEFQRILNDIAACLERISQQNRWRRFLNQQDDKEELSKYQSKISLAMIQFLVRDSLCMSSRVLKYLVLHGTRAGCAA